MNNIEVCDSYIAISSKIGLSFFVLSILVYCIYGLLSLQKREFRYIFWWCVLSVVLNLLDLGYIFLADTYTETMMAWINFTGGALYFTSILHQLKNFLLIGFFFAAAFKNQTLVTNTRRAIFLAVIASIASYALLQGWRSYNSIAYTIEAVFLFTLPLLALYSIFLKSSSLPIWKNSYFWIAIGLMLPNILGLFLFFTGDHLAEQDFCLFARFSVVKNGFEVIGQLCFVKAFTLAKYLKYIPGI